MTDSPITSDDENKLPDNLPECHKVITELRADVKRLSQIAETVSLLQKRISELEVQVRNHKRARFGKSSAVVAGASLTGTGKVVYDQSRQELEDEKTNLNIVQDEKPNGGGGRTAPDNAKRAQDIQHKITDPDVLRCPCCGKLREVIGFTVSKQLDVIKTALEQLKHIQYKYSCPKCEGEIILAPKPDTPIAKGYATAGLIAHVGVSKFDWHLPLYRQERISRAQSVPIPRASMCRWLKNAADFLKLIVSRMNELMLNSRVIQSDHTTMPVIKKGLGKTHQGYLWIYRGDEKFQYVIYDFTETKEQVHPKRMLPGYKGILQTDGASDFNGVSAKDEVTGEKGASRAGCLSHAFRYWEAARDEDRERADFALAHLKVLFEIEELAEGLTEEERKGLRRRKSKPKLAELKFWLDVQAEDPTILPKSNLGKALTYCLNQWEPLCFYADTGFVAAHNNLSENGLRPAVLGKNNWLFAGSVDGGCTAAVWMSLIQTCHRLKIDPFEYLKDVLTRLPSASIADIDQFLPDRWKAQQVQA